jgi:hypothetical protein
MQGQNLFLKFTNRINSEKGSSLLVTLIAMAFISAMVSMSWKYVQDRQGNWLERRILNSRDLVMTMALRNSRVATYFYYTLLTASSKPFNADFFACIMPGNPADPTKCVSKNGAGVQVTHAVRLYTDLAGSDGLIAVGDTNMPAHYDIYGQICSTPSDSCPFDVTGEYLVNCDSGTSTCDQADNIDFTVHINVNPTVAAHFTNMATVSGTQKIHIANFWDDYMPVLPPAVVDNVTGAPLGGPITVGAGPGGYIVSHTVVPPQPPPSGAQSPPGPASPPTTGCGNGRVGSGCARFKF